MAPENRRPWVVMVIAAVILAGCARAHWPAEGDSAPRPGSVPNIASIPDPVPRNEPHSRYGNPASYEVFGRTYYTMDSAEGYVERGVASWYGTKFHGRRTSSGEPYDMYAMTAAHTRLPLPTYVRVTHLENNRSIIVRVNDRGPFVDNRIIDLSYVAAKKLDMHEQGTAPVEVRAIVPGRQPDTGPPAARRISQPVSTASDSGPVFLQFGAFYSRENAEKLRRQLESRDIGPVFIHESGQGEARLFRVRAGPASNSRELDRMSSAAAKMGVYGTHVVFD